MEPLAPQEVKLIPKKVSTCDIIGIEETMDVKDRINRFNRGEENFVGLKMETPIRLPPDGRRRPIQ